jgi:ABC-type transport system involved in cytochrome c biogenesis permease subunit
VQDKRRTKRQAGFGFLVCSLLALAVIFFARWQPRADFDVAGVLWLMQNVLPLTAFCILFVGASGAGIVWLRCTFANAQDKTKRNA